MTHILLWMSELNDTAAFIHGSKTSRKKEDLIVETLLSAAIYCDYACAITVYGCKAGHALCFTELLELVETTGLNVMWENVWEMQRLWLVDASHTSG